MRVVILWRQWFVYRVYDFTVASLTPINARPCGSLARFVNLVELGVIRLEEMVWILVLSHAANPAF